MAQRRPKLGLALLSAERFYDRSVIRRLETLSRIVGFGIEII